MDCVFTWDYNSLINELTQGMEHTKQLRTYLSSVASTSEPTPVLLLQKILSSYEQSLLILKWNGLPVQSQLAMPPSAGANESMVSGDGSPRNDDKKRSFKLHQDLIHISKRRKSQLTHQVRVNIESGFEGPPDDGYSWRMYGQKLIFGVDFQRVYYRCTFHVIGNCWATKHVQRSAVDHNVLEITYYGDHAHHCRQVTNSTLQATSPEKQAKHHSLFDSFEDPTDDGYSWRKYGQKDIPGAKCTRSYYRCTYRYTQNCRATKQVQRLDEDPTAFVILYISYHTCHLAANSAIQATSPEKEPSHYRLIVGGGYSPSFVSPTTPESNYFSVSSCQMNGLGIVPNLDHSESYLSDIGIFLELRHSDSDRTDTFSANTSTTSSSIGGEFARSRLDFSIWSRRHPQIEDNTPQKDD